jgi:hypothetical protein
MHRRLRPFLQVDFGNFTMTTRNYVNAYHFRSQAQQRRLSDLSGGELNRVHLARSLIRRPNVIMLDEPTNDLDVEVLRRYAPSPPPSTHKEYAPRSTHSAASVHCANRLVAALRGVAFDQCACVRACMCVYVWCVCARGDLCVLLRF